MWQLSRVLDMVCTGLMDRHLHHVFFGTAIHDDYVASLYPGDVLLASVHCTLYWLVGCADMLLQY